MVEHWSPKPGVVGSSPATPAIFVALGFFVYLFVILCYNGFIMEGNRNKPRALLVFGAPCSGRTTFAMKFADKFSLAYYDLDDIKNEHNLSHKNFLYVLELIARTKQTIVIDGGLTTEKDRSEIRSVLFNAGYEPSLIWIQTDVATLRVRLKTKYRSLAKAKEAYEEAVNEIEAPSDLEHPIILSGKHTFETQAKHVITGLADLNLKK